MAGQRDITLLPLDASPANIVLGVLPAETPASLTFYLTATDANPNNIVLRDSTQAPAASGGAQNLDVLFIAGSSVVYTPDLDQHLGVPFVVATGSAFAPALDQTLTISFIASGSVVFTPDLDETLSAPFIPAGSVVYAPALDQFIAIPFIASESVVYAPTLVAPQTLDIPFIAAGSDVFSPTLEVASGLRGRVRSSRTVKLRLVEDERRREAAKAATINPAPAIADNGQDTDRKISVEARAGARRRRLLALARSLDLAAGADLAAEVARVNWQNLVADAQRAAQARADAEALLALLATADEISGAILVEQQRQTAMAARVIESIVAAQAALAAEIARRDEDDDEAAAFLLLAA